ncbi:MAG TPA: hypothetical protein PK867_07030 [Pirellulales bacterium]|nr:hypothetical protein [Pirellulales bacterium]
MRIDHTQCTLCGQSAQGTWHGTDGAIAVCHRCAVEALPALIADAVCLAADDPRLRAVQVCRQVEASYWRALALRLLTEGQR